MQQGAVHAFAYATTESPDMKKSESLSWTSFQLDPRTLLRDGKLLACFLTSPL